MTDLRRKRLLILACHGGNHKRYYSQYCELMREYLVRWCLGMAFITDAGIAELDRLRKEETPR